MRPGVEMSDLDRAAFRRTVRANADVVEHVCDLYFHLLLSPIPMLVQRGVAFETYRGIIDAGITMVYIDVDQQARGLPQVGGPSVLYLRFLDVLGGDHQFAFHACRIILFAITGMVAPGGEDVTRQLVVAVEDTWNRYAEALR